MSSLSNIDKMKLEKLFGMSSGYVLDFSNRTFAEFIRDSVKIDIYDGKYDYESGSKANRLRAFWDIESDKIVGTLLIDMLERWETYNLLNDIEPTASDKKIYQDCLNAANRLLGKNTATVATRISATEDDFLRKEFAAISLKKLRLDGVITAVLEQRLDEIEKCLNAKSSLAVIFLSGSTLEGILLGVASTNQKLFNKSTACPKDKSGKVHKFHDWTLNDFINVACDVGMLGLDVKKFSHALRDFRNYIHPFQQMASRFNPDDHTARICWQVLRAAIADLCRKS